MFDIKLFKEKNGHLSVGVLLSFLEVEIKEYYVKEIEVFLLTCEIGKEIELTDHIMKKIAIKDILVYNETLEQFARNPGDYRFEITINQLHFLIRQKMLHGMNRVRSILSC